MYDGRPPFSRHATAEEFYQSQAATLATIRTAATTSTMTAAEADFALQALDGLEQYLAVRKKCGGGSGLATARKLIIEAQAIAAGGADPARITALRKLKDYSIIATSIDFCSSSRRTDDGGGYDQGDELPA